jgi:hypothetical protein
MEMFAIIAGYGDFCMVLAGILSGMRLLRFQNKRCSASSVGKRQSAGWKPRSVLEDASCLMRRPCSDFVTS